MKLSYISQQLVNSQSCRSVFYFILQKFFNKCFISRTDFCFAGTSSKLQDTPALLSVSSTASARDSVQNPIKMFLFEEHLILLHLIVVDFVQKRTACVHISLLKVQHIPDQTNLIQSSSTLIAVRYPPVSEKPLVNFLCLC